MKKHVQSIELIFTAACNMRCPYCFIHKQEEHMADANKEIQNAIMDGTYSNNVIRVFKDYKETMTHLSLWGGEPTLNRNYFHTLVEPIVDYFPHVREIMFSTNSYLGAENLKPFADSIYKMSHEKNREMCLELQFSLDGPAFINDSNRNKDNITELTLQTIKEFSAYLNEKCDELFHAKLYCKPTLSPENMQEIMDSPDGVLGWYKFYHSLQEWIEERYDNPNIHFDYLGQPTFVIPGNYTNSDGVIFCNFVKEVKKIDVDKEIPLYRRMPALIPRFWGHYQRGYNEADPGPWALTCAAGNCDYSIDCHGNFMSCHRVYDNVNMGGVTDPKAKAALATEIAKDERDIDRVLFTSDTFHCGQIFREHHIFALLLAMVGSGELDKKYLKLEYRKFLHLCVSTMKCYAGEAQDLTANHYITTAGYIRLLCNGALEEILDYYESLGI